MQQCLCDAWGGLALAGTTGDQVSVPETPRHSGARGVPADG